MKKAIIFLMVLTLAVPASGQRKAKNKKQAPVPVENTVSEAVRELNYYTGFLLAYVLLYEDGDYVDVLKKNFDGQPILQGLEEALYTTDWYNRTNDISQKVEELLAELAGPRGDDPPKAYTLEMIADLLSSDMYSGMRPLTDKIWYEVRNPGQGDYLAGDQPVMLESFLASSSGRQLEVDKEEVDGWEDINEPFRQLFDQARMNYHVRFLIFDDEYFHDYPLRAGEEPYLIGEIVISPITLRKDSSWDSIVPALEDLARQWERNEAPRPLLDAPMFSGMDASGEYIRRQILDTGVGEVLPEDAIIKVNITAYDRAGEEITLPTTERYTVRDFLEVMDLSPGYELRQHAAFRVFYSMEDLTASGEPYKELPLFIYQMKVSEIVHSPLEE